MTENPNPGIPWSAAVLVALAVGLCLAVPAEASAAWAQAPGFPRGPGFYFHPLKLLFVGGVFLAWLRTCAWVDDDCAKLHLRADFWNPLVFGTGVVGLVFVWALPYFWVSFAGLLACYLTPSLFYVKTRNAKVPYPEKVLTPRHLRTLANRHLKLKLEVDTKKVGEDRKPLPLRFIGRGSGGRTEDPARVAQAQESKGYRAALELVQEALHKRATDIHLEPTPNEMTVRYRIDGILHAGSTLTRATGDSVLNIFKVLANLDITEKRKPQDGSFSAELFGTAPKVRKKRKVEEDLDRGETQDDGSTRKRQIDFRIATAGSVTGEKIVMRILDRSKQINDLGQVGMREKLREQTRALVTRPHGLFVVCGPTGSGKSTTLYACLCEIDRYQKNVITVENPVEYQIPNVTQIEINTKAGKTFAGELRSILRQDPDVIYIGEVRDQETAEIACQAAQTGHMVFTTLHANDTTTALARLLDLGVEPFMVANAVSAVLGQRLVRLLCPKCKVKYRPNPDLLRKANLPVERIKFFYRPPRQDDPEESAEICPHCGGTGYFGRTGIFEMLVVSDAIREQLRERPDLDAIRQEAARDGMEYLQQDGMRLVIAGETSIDELLRVAR